MAGTRISSSVAAPQLRLRITAAVVCLTCWSVSSYADDGNSKSVLAPDSASTKVVADDGKAEVIKALSKNESLYDNLEVTWVGTFEFGKMKHALPSTVKHREDRGRYVRQKGMYYLSVERDQNSITDTDDELKHWSILSGFDGGFTRSLENNGGFTGNIVSGLRDNGERFLPHTICLPVQYRWQLVPLSVWLSGEEAVAAWPGGKAGNNMMHERTVTYSGRETVDGLPCEKLTVDFRALAEPKPVIGRNVFWLAEERNYLPIQTKHFTLKVSADVPISETAMSDLREIRPGVWFPYHCRMTLFDQWAFVEDGQRVVAWTEEHVVKVAKLDPHYDTEFFQIPFPDGTPVYEVKEKEIENSYVQGEVRPAEEPPPSHARLWFVIAINSAIVLALMVFLVVRRKRARAMRQA